MTRAEDVLFEVGNQGESHTVEFKESLTTSARRKAIEAMVAFTNSEGGWVFFGVTDDRFLKGVQIGGNTLEKLAVEIRDHIFPSLPVIIEAIPGRDRRKHVVAVEVPADVPPVIGVYVCSAKAIPPSEPVDTSEVQAFRRVGRTNQKEDFMRLRQPLDSDPEVVIRLNGAGGAAGGHFPLKQDFYYSNSGLGWAYNVVFTADHEDYQLQASPARISLPPRDQENPHYREHPRQGEVSVVDADQGQPSNNPAYLRATYEDANGLAWQSVLELVPTRRDSSKELYEFLAGRFRRRIIRFPAKID